MSLRVLVACYEVPGYGGAATAAYRLFETLREGGLEVAYVSLIEARDEDFYRFALGDAFGNPRRHDGVFVESLGAPLYRAHDTLRARIDALDPQVVLAVGFIAAFLVDAAAPGRTLAFLTTGCQQAKEAIVDGRASDVAALEQAIGRSLRRPYVSCLEEKAAVDGADVVFVHSPLVRSLFAAYFPFQTGKIYDEVISFAEWIHGDALAYADLARPFAERDVDVLFVASSWQRPEKNYAFVHAIAAGLRSASVHVVGEFDEPVAGAVHHGLIGDRRELFALFGRARSVVCPSSFDAAPGVLFEASALGANVVASANCGNVELCHEALRVDPFTAEAFLARIETALERTLPDRIDAFLALRSRDALIETLQVL